MKLIESILKDHVLIDFGAEIMYGSDNIFEDATGIHKFATVTFQLMSTNLLTEIADNIRVKLGYKPMTDSTDHEYDPEGWYDFVYTIDGLDGFDEEPYIGFIVVYSEQSDNGSFYRIELTQDEKQYMCAHLDAQCRTYLHESCADLLKAAWRRMKGCI